MTREDSNQPIYEFAAYDYLEILVRRRRLLILSIVVFTAIGVFVSHEPTAPVYRCAVNLVVGDVREFDAKSSRINKKEFNLEEFAENAEIAVRIVGTNLSTSDDDSVKLWDVIAPGGSLDDAVAYLRRATQVRGDGTGVVVISVSLADSLVAEAAARAYAAEFKTYVWERTELERDSYFLDKRIETLKGELVVLSDSLTAYRSAYAGTSRGPAPNDLRLWIEWTSREMDVRLALYSSLLQDRERLRLEAYSLHATNYEIAGYSRSRTTTVVRFTVWQRVWGSAAIALFFSVVLCAVAEWFSTSRAEGRWDGVGRAWRNEPRGS